MTTTLTQNDSESLVSRIIEELRANPEAQALLLRALLTDEFLCMPIRLKRVEADVAQLKVDVSVLKTDVAQLKTDVAQLKTDVAQLKGASLEVKLYRRIRPLLSQRFNLRRGLIMQRSLQDPRPDFFEPVEKSYDAGVIYGRTGSSDQCYGSDYARTAQGGLERWCKWQWRCTIKSGSATLIGGASRLTP